jgi:predicted nucleic acid-binding protein
MEVIIDTNIIFGDWMLRTEDAKAFLAYVERTSSIIYIPKIVWEETQKNYQDDLAAKHSAYEKACKALGRTLINQPDFNRVSIHEDDAEWYLDWLRKKLQFASLENILPYGDFTERIANRAMTKRKPFNQQNNNEYKDCLVWETIIDVLSGTLGRGDTEVVLISNDANAFGAGRISTGKQQERGQRLEKQTGILHPQLQEETDKLSTEKEKTFYYYESFAEFLAAHYTPIKGIDEESVREYLSQEESGFAQLIQKELSIRMPSIITYLQSTYRPSSISLSEFTINKLSLIQDFYVYSFQKGKKISASGRVFVYLKANANHRYAGDRKDFIVELYPTAEVKFNLSYIESNPSSLTFESFSLPLDSGMQLPEAPKSAFEQWIEAYRATQYNSISVTEQIQKILYEQETSVFNPLRHLDLSNYASNIANPPYGGDIWQIREVKKENFDSPSSRFLPKRAERVPVPKNIPSKLLLASIAT